MKPVRPDLAAVHLANRPRTPAVICRGYGRQPYARIALGMVGRAVHIINPLYSGSTYGLGWPPEDVFEYAPNRLQALEEEYAATGSTSVESWAGMRLFDCDKHFPAPKAPPPA